MTERHFTEKEIAEILTRATRPVQGSRALPSRSEGLTLAQLKEVASEAGIDPERVESAALELGRPQETVFGLPRSVSREIRIPGALDDEAWERLVARLRATFGAKGETSVEGSLRSWSHEEVEVHVEPDPRSHQWRIRIEARNENDADGLQFGGLLAPTGALLPLLPALTGAPTGLYWAGLVLFLGGIGIGGWSAFILPRWAEKREDQIRTLEALLRQEPTRRDPTGE